MLWECSQTAHRGVGSLKSSPLVLCLDGKTTPRAKDEWRRLNTVWVLAGRGGWQRSCDFWALRGSRKGEQESKDKFHQYPRETGPARCV